jgi:ParB-like chromosome segregation protein Spo0J
MSKTNGKHPKEEIEWLDPRDIGNFQAQQEDYGASPPDQDFIDSVKTYSIRIPLTVAAVGAKRICLSGYRRRAAAIIADLKQVPCRVLHGLTEDQMEEEFLLGNKYRDKTVEEKLREAQRWERLLSKQADERQKAGTQASRDAKGKTSAKAAEKVGLSAATVERAKPVLAAMDEAAAAGDTEKVEKIREAVNTGGVATAARIVKQSASDLRDQAGVPVPDELEPTFKLASELTGVIQSIGRLGSKVEQVFEGTSGIGDLRVDKVVDHLNRAQNELSLKRPFCVCPACDGRKKCPRCDGRKWLTKSEHKNLTPELAAKLEAMK